MTDQTSASCGSSLDGRSYRADTGITISAKALQEPELSSAFRSGCPAGLPENLQARGPSLLRVFKAQFRRPEKWILFFQRFALKLSRRGAATAIILPHFRPSVNNRLTKPLDTVSEVVESAWKLPCRDSWAGNPPSLGALESRHTNCRGIPNSRTNFKLLRSLSIKSGLRKRAS